jgi:hypothetical protein
VAIARVHVGLQRYDSTRAAAFYDALRARLTRGVGAEVALAQTLPLQGDENVTIVRLPPPVPTPRRAGGWHQPGCRPATCAYSACRCAPAATSARATKPEPTRSPSSAR